MAFKIPKFKLTFSDWLGIGLFAAGLLLTKPKSVKGLPRLQKPLPGSRTAREAELGLFPGDEGLISRIEKKWGDKARDAHKIYPTVSAQEILRFIHLESRGYKNAHDDTVNATGLLQLTPQAQQQYSVIDPTNPWDNIEGGAHMLADLHQIYADNPVYIAAAFYDWPLDLRPMKQPGSIVFDKDTTAYVKRALALQKLYSGEKS
jgi:soluble lytic murein transglycosylase-like protein